MDMQGSLSEVELSAFVSLLDTIDIDSEFPLHASDAVLAAFKGNGKSWASFYQLDFLETVIKFATVIGAEGAFKNSVSTNDLISSAIESAYIAPENLNKAKGIEDKIIIGLYWTIFHNIKAISTYGRSINQLLQLSKLGNDKALFYAIRIDKAVVNCEIAADRIATAALTCETKFFKDLSNALKYQRKNDDDDSESVEDKRHRNLRFALCLMSDKEGAIESLTEKSAYQLFCVSTDIYPEDGEGRNPWKFISRWKTLYRT